MRIIYYVDSSDAVNWGGQATSAGIRHLVTRCYPGATFTPVKFGELPFKNATFLRWIPNLLIYWFAKTGNLPRLKRVLHWYGVDPGLYEQYDVVCFNGEGAIHDRSGHYFRLLGSLLAFKMSGKRVYSLNQTVDIRPGSRHARMMQVVYPQLDRVAVREPVSFRLLQSLGIRCELIGDAAYALPRLPDDERERRFAKFGIAKPFIAITASSAMKRNRKAVRQVERLVNVAKSFGRPVVFLANTKTDLYVARKLAPRHDLRVVGYADADYLDAIALIAHADLVIGGRQHPNIFAAKYGVPFIGLAGNTHKMSGVAELLGYPVPVFTWSFDDAEMKAEIARILSGGRDFSAVRVPSITAIDLGPAT